MSDFGGSGITRECYDWIIANIPKGSLILELGSGPVSTERLSAHYRMVSVEHDLSYVNKYNSEYVHAPLAEDGWYSLQPIKDKLAELVQRGDHYAMILVDGPVGSEPRYGFMRNASLFDLSVPILVDDVWRAYERLMTIKLGKLVQRRPLRWKQFAVV